MVSLVAEKNDSWQEASNRKRAPERPLAAVSDRNPLFGTRYYDPSVGRWTQQDPVAGSIGDPASVNRFVYVGDDPVKFVDPKGLWRLGDNARQALGGIAKIVGGGAAVAYGPVPVKIGGALAVASGIADIADAVCDTRSLTATQKAVINGPLLQC